MGPGLLVLCSGCLLGVPLPLIEDRGVDTDGLNDSEPIDTAGVVDTASGDPPGVLMSCQIGEGTFGAGGYSGAHASVLIRYDASASTADLRTVRLCQIDYVATGSGAASCSGCDYAFQVVSSGASMTIADRCSEYGMTADSFPLSPTALGLVVAENKLVAQYDSSSWSYFAELLSEVVVDESGTFVEFQGCFQEE